MCCWGVSYALAGQQQPAVLQACEKYARLHVHPASPAAAAAAAITSQNSVPATTCRLPLLCCAVHHPPMLAPITVCTSSLHLRSHFVGLGLGILHTRLLPTPPDLKRIIQVSSAIANTGNGSGCDSAMEMSPVSLWYFMPGEDPHTP